MDSVIDPEKDLLRELKDGRERAYDLVFHRYFIFQGPCPFRQEIPLGFGSFPTASTGGTGRPVHKSRKFGDQDPLRVSL
jgi:hypothetical protein